MRPRPDNYRTDGYAEEQTALSRTLANTETLKIAEIHLLDTFCTPIEERFERITRLGLRSLRTPVLGITAISHETQWFKSVYGWDAGDMPLSQSLCARTVRKAQPVVVPDLARHVAYRAHKLVAGPPAFRFYAGAPLFNAKKAIIGTLCAMDFKARRLSQAGYQSLLDLADLAQRELLTGFLQSAQSALVSKLSIARRQALIDPLTHVWNRRGGELLIDESIAKAAREQKSLAILAVDVNDFKRVNDTFGHAIGDRALQMVARELLACVRENDGVCRCGGDEFFVVISGASRDAIDRIASRARQRIEKCVIHQQDGQDARVSVAIGIQFVKPGHDLSATELLERADHALYEAKLQVDLKG